MSENSTKSLSVQTLAATRTTTTNDNDEVDNVCGEKEEIS